MNNTVLISWPAAVTLFCCGTVFSTGAAADGSHIKVLPDSHILKYTDGRYLRSTTARDVLLRLAQSAGGADDINAILGGGARNAVRPPRRNNRTGTTAPRGSNQATPDTPAARPSSPVAVTPPNRPALPAAEAPSEEPVPPVVNAPVRERSAWTAFWWPLRYEKKERMYSPNGPAAKYDKYVKLTTGKDPKWQDWEKANHDGKDRPEWHGHCHALSAAAILEAEPVKAKTINGITFSILEQKAMLTEAHFDDATLWLKGKRYTKEGDNYNDPSPDVMHWLLINWMKYERNAPAPRTSSAEAQASFANAGSSQKFMLLEGSAKYGTASQASIASAPEQRVRHGKGKPFIMDKVAGPEVWNHVVYKYKMWYAEVPGKPNTWNVKAKVYYSDFAKHTPDFVGVIPLTQDYTYEISGDFSKPTAGKWLGESTKEHPDFFWYPKYATYGDGAPIDYKIIKQIVK